MCGRKLKVFLLSLVLFSALPFSQSLSYSYAEVILTEEEAQQILEEIQEAKKELIEQKTELENVKNTCNEQKTYYETQLTEAEKKNSNLKTAVITTSVSTVISIIIAVLAIIF